MAKKLALVLPGRGYTPLGPAIRFPILALEQLGFEEFDVSSPNASVLLACPSRSTTWTLACTTSAAATRTGTSSTC